MSQQLPAAANVSGLAASITCAVLTACRIKCIRCSKRKPPTSYSDARQKDLRDILARNPALDAAVVEHVACRDCAGGQVTELECHMCWVWKGLDSFNKAQRKNPDGAVC